MESQATHSNCSPTCGPSWGHCCWWQIGQHGPSPGPGSYDEDWGKHHPWAMSCPHCTQNLPLKGHSAFGLDGTLSSLAAEPRLCPLGAAESSCPLLLNSGSSYRQRHRSESGLQTQTLHFRGVGVWGSGSKALLKCGHKRDIRCSNDLCVAGLQTILAESPLFEDGTMVAPEVK